MSKQRADLGFGSVLGELDGFTPQPKPKPKPAGQTDTKKVAESAGFKSREPKPEPKPVKQRRRRTGRNAQFNIKVKPETIEAFYKIADANDWGLGETLEHAVALLEREYKL